MSKYLLHISVCKCLGLRPEEKKKSLVFILFDQRLQILWVRIDLLCNRWTVSRYSEIQISQSLYTFL